VASHRPVHVVDNRVFLIGLDGLYRQEMKGHERDELLQCARRVAATLGVGPARVPVEGYYADDRWLTEYFLLMRALQHVDESRRPQVAALPAFQRLLAVTSSALFGTMRFGEGLLPQGVDPLGKALDQTTDWSLARLIPAARAAALANDDCSLAGLAARANDAVVLTATRESVLLYAMVMVLGLPAEHETPRFDWQVDDELVQAATRFVHIFGSSGPQASARTSRVAASGWARRRTARATITGPSAAIGIWI
jgi:hypothetical protein